MTWPLDAIRLEALWSRLVEIADEVATTLLRRVLTIIRESNDTVVLMNPAGDDTGEDSFAGPSDAVRAIADRAMRRAVAAIPHGIYRSALDADGVPGQTTRIECAITVRGEQIGIDYTGQLTAGDAH